MSRLNPLPCYNHIGDVIARRLRSRLYMKGAQA